MAVLLMSGLQIFNAHPALYWGNDSDFAHPVFAITADSSPGGGQRGVITLLGRSLDTTGVLGLSRQDGMLQPRAFPSWATLPSWQSLADGRRWHFFFAWVFAANLVVYLLHGVMSGHFWRDVLPSWRDLRDVPRTTWDHIRFRFPRGEAARHYNVLQKGAYSLVVFCLIPILLLAGLAMSPRLDAGFPQLPQLFGGRQSARAIHFIAAWTLVAFVLVHVLMVLVSGAWNDIRSMVTGRYAVDMVTGKHD